jgi:hypothetical protein
MNNVYRLPILHFFTMKTLYLGILMMIFSYACTQQQDTPPPGKTVAWEDLDDLMDRSYSQLDARKNELELRIGLLKDRFTLGESIEIIASLTNKTDKSIVVRRLDAMPIFGNDATSVHGIRLILTAQSTSTSLDSGFLLDLVQEGLPPPESFVVIPAYDSHTVTCALSDIFKTVLADKYSLEINYTNDYFGAQTNDGSVNYFIDYNAWIGTLSSNVEYFQITP